MKFSKIGQSALFLSCVLGASMCAMDEKKQDVKESWHLTHILSANGANKVILSNDGKLIISASGDTVTVWDAETNKVIKSKMFDSAGVNGIAISEDNKFITIAFEDGLIEMWNLENDKQVTVCESQLSGGFTALTRNEKVPVGVSKNNKFVVYDKVHKWNANGLGPVRILVPDENTMRIRDLRSNEEIRLQYRGENSSYHISNDGKYIISSDANSNNKEVSIHDSSNGNKLKTLAVPTVSSLTMSNDSKHIIIGIWHYVSLFNCIYEIRALKWETGEVLASTPVQAQVNSIAISKDSNCIVAGLADGSLVIWNLQDKKAVVYRASIYPIIDVKISNDAKSIIFTTTKNIKIWRFTANQAVVQDNEDDGGCVIC